MKQPIFDEAKLGDYEERLRAAGQFVTVQRRAILRYLLRNRVHPTTTQIARAIGKSGSASVATVYNNLALFAELRMVQAMRAPSGSGETNWDIRTDAHHHLHCTSCSVVHDIEWNAAEVLIHDRGLARRVDSSQIWLSGICVDCQSKS